MIQYSEMDKPRPVIVRDDRREVPLLLGSPAVFTILPPTAGNSLPLLGLFHSREPTFNAYVPM